MYAMDFRSALNSTIDVFHLKAGQIAERAEISASVLSRFRSGKQGMTDGNLHRLIQALPPEARFYYLALLSSDEQRPVDDFYN